MRTATAVVFSLLIVLRGAAGSGPGLQSDRPVRVVDKLEVNTSNSQRYVAYGKCEDEGVRDISTLLQQSNIEELWAYLPRAQPSGTCQWHELGRNVALSMKQFVEVLNTQYLRVGFSPFTKSQL